MTILEPFIIMNSSCRIIGFMRVKYTFNIFDTGLDPTQPDPHKMENCVTQPDPWTDHKTCPTLAYYVSKVQHVKHLELTSSYYLCHAM